MSKRDPRIPLHQMLDHAQEAIQIAQETDRAGLEKDRLRFHALVRLIEIVGEAATRVPPETREQHPQIPWADVVGMRNKLIHGYDAVDLDILWNVLENDLPELVTHLQAALND